LNLHNIYIYITLGTWEAIFIIKIILGGLGTSNRFCRGHAENQVIYKRSFKSLIYT